jgi:hypothetical protein
VRVIDALLLYRGEDYYRGKAYGAQMDGDWKILKTVRKSLA